MLSEEIKVGKIKIPNEMVRPILLACLQPGGICKFCILFGKSAPPEEVK